VLTSSSPQEALGLPSLQSSFQPGPTKQCFNITCTLQDVRENSAYHPTFHYGINGPGVPLEEDAIYRLHRVPHLDADIPGITAQVPGVKCSQLDPAKAAPDIKTLKFLLNLPHENRPYTWEDIKEKELEPIGELEVCIFLSRLT
jgi:hypothetical protein